MKDKGKDVFQWCKSRWCLYSEDSKVEAEEEIIAVKTNKCLLMKCIDAKIKLDCSSQALCQAKRRIYGRVSTRPNPSTEEISLHGFLCETCLLDMGDI